MDKVHDSNINKEIKKRRQSLLNVKEQKGAQDHVFFLFQEAR